MLLTIDIGNTNISIGVFKEDSLIAKKSLKTNLKSSQMEVRDEILDFLKSDLPNYINLNRAIIAAGVIPEILDAAPRVGGLINDSFSTISFDKLPTYL